MAGPAIEAMWKDETGRGWPTWRDAAHADATRHLYRLLNAVMSDCDAAMRAASELAKGLYVNEEQQLLESWGKLFAIVETQPEYDRDGNEIKPMVYQEQYTLPAAIRRMQEAQKKPSLIWGVLKGGRK